MELNFETPEEDVLPKMSLDGLWVYNLDKQAFKNMFIDRMFGPVIDELLKVFNVERLGDLAFFVPSWKSPYQRGVQYDNFFQDLRYGRHVSTKLVCGSKIEVLKYMDSPYVVFYGTAAQLNPDFICFKKGEQPSI